MFELSKSAEITNHSTGDISPTAPPAAIAPVVMISTRMPVVNDQYGKAIDGVVPFSAIIKATDPKPIRDRPGLIDEIQRTDRDRKKRATTIATAQRTTDPTRIFVSEQYQLVVYDDDPALMNIDLNSCDFAELLASFGENLLKADGGTRHLAHRSVIDPSIMKGKKQVAEPRPEFINTPVKVCLHIVERDRGLFMKMFQNFNSDRTKISRGLMDLIKAYGFVWEEHRSKVLVGDEAAESIDRLLNEKKHYVVALRADPEIPQFKGLISRPNEVSEDTEKKLPFDRVSAAIDTCINTAKWSEGQFGQEFNALPSDKLIKTFHDVITLTHRATGDWVFGEEEFKKWIEGAFSAVFMMNVAAPMYIIRKIYDREKSMDDAYTLSMAVADSWKYYPQIGAVLEAEKERAVDDRYNGRTTSSAKGEAWGKIKHDLDNIRL